jgi:hypothetical protein
MWHAPQGLVVAIQGETSLSRRDVSDIAWRWTAPGGRGRFRLLAELVLAGEKSRDFNHLD